jgi:hypothetical protein
MQGLCQHEIAGSSMNHPIGPRKLCTPVPVPRIICTPWFWMKIAEPDKNTRPNRYRQLFFAAGRGDFPF